MKSIYFVAALFVMLVQGSWQRSLQDTEEKSSSFPALWTDSLNDLHQIHKEKRQEGSIPFGGKRGRIITDFHQFENSECLEDFFSWMTRNQLNGIAKRDDEFERHAEGTFTSDLNSYLEGQAAKEFIACSLVTFPAMVRRRHADGSFSDEMNTGILPPWNL